MKSVKRTFRIDSDKWDKLTILKQGAGSSYSFLIDKAIGAFLDKNSHLFPLKEDPVAEENTERNNTLSLFSDHEETKW